MRTLLLMSMCTTTFLAVPLAALAADDLSGVWEVESLGSDRRVEVWQDGDEIIAYRVMYPEFEGERYKLEHLLRGKISGTRIAGQLFVREEGVPEFDSLRPFYGRIDGDTKVLLDGLPIGKTVEKLNGEPPTRQKKGKRSGRSPKEAL
ncbi:MAG: hypothetical protein AAB426_05905 [Myxococcota bacterium]